MKKKSKKQEIKAQENFLRQLFHNWDPISAGIPPHTPLDEYDSTIYKIISGLHSDLTYDTLSKLISENLMVKVSDQELIKYTKKIWSWWQALESRRDIRQ